MFARIHNAFVGGEHSMLLTVHTRSADLIRWVRAVKRLRKCCCLSFGTTDRKYQITSVVLYDPVRICDPS